MSRFHFSLAVFSALIVSGCVTDPAAERAKIIANVRQTCSGLGYKEGSAEHARCSENMFLRVGDSMDQEASGRRQAVSNAGNSLIAAGAAMQPAQQAHGTVICNRMGNSTNCSY